MGGCLKDSGTITFVVREPQVIGAEVTDGTPFNVRVDLEFDEPMNQLLTPADSNVELVYNGTPAWLSFDSWTDATHARYGIALPWPPPNATVQLKVTDPNLQDLDGLVCITSDPIVIVP